MKKTFRLIAAAAAVLAAASCAKEIQPASEEDLVQVRIQVELPQTKADIVGNKLAFEKGDVVAVYDMSAVRKFTCVEGGYFEGEVAASATDIQVVYPYSETLESGSLAVPAVPAVQTITEGNNIAQDAVVMKGQGKLGETVKMENGCALVRFAVADGATEITLSGIGASTVTAKVPGNGTYAVAVEAMKAEGLAVLAKKGENWYLKSGSTKVDLKVGDGLELGTVDDGEKAAVISNAEELAAFTAGEDTSAVLTSDIDMSSVSLSAKNVRGTFEGLGHSLKNWSATKPLLDTLYGTMRNVMIDKTCSYTPAAAGKNAFLIGVVYNGAVYNCVNNGAPATFNDASGAQSWFGFIAARLAGADSKLVNCGNYGDFNFTFDNLGQTQYLGGLVGLVGFASTNVRVDGCYNYGNLKVDVISSVGKHITLGGIAGASGINAVASASDYGFINDCSNCGNITITHPNGGTSIYMEAGGIAGYFEGSVTKCNNEGKISIINSNTVYTARPSVAGIVSAVSGKVSDCTNEGEIYLEGMFANGANNTSAWTGGIKEAAVAGIAGVVGNVAGCDCGISNCTNYGKITTRATMDSSAGSFCDFAGVVGYTYGPVTKCTNAGELDLVIGSKVCYLGGVAGYAQAVEFSDCHNKGAMNIAATEGFTGNQAYQLYIAGINGYALKGAKYTDCSNEAAVTLGAAGSSAVYSYLGGIIGNYSGAITMTDCSNSGALTSNAACGIRLGGLGGALNGTITGCTNTGVLSMSNGTLVSKKEPEVGGLAGYVNATFNNCANKGDITSTVEGGFIGGFVGAAGNADKTWTGNTVDCAITAPDNYKGSVVGHFNNVATNVVTWKEGTICSGLAALQPCGLLNGNTFTIE